MVGRIAVLLAVSAVLAVTANAVSPRGVPWNARLDQTLRARALRAGLVPLGTSDIRRLAADVAVVDARAPAHFKAGHLPGALSLPFEDRENALSKLNLPLERRIVVYCGTEYCDIGLNLGTWLIRRGYTKVALFIDGYDRWRADGF